MKDEERKWRTGGTRTRDVNVTTATATATAKESTMAATTNAHGYDYDLFVIGCGSGGIRAGRIAAKNHGAKVCIADDMAVGLGGMCVNVGCVPKKLMVYGSEYGEAVEDAKGFGWNFSSEVDVDFKRLIENKDTEIHRLNGIYGWLVENANATLVKSRAHIVDIHGCLSERELH